MITTANNSITNTEVAAKKHHHHYSNGIMKDTIYHPLPTILTDFFAIKLHDLIRIRPLPIGSKRTAPELMYFILKITTQARISCHIAIVALIYIERCKAVLPKNAIGDQDTIHRIFIASLLVASKYLHGTCWAHSQQLSDSVLAEDEIPVWLNNARMADICSRFYTLKEINQLELSFLNLIKFECFINPIEVQHYLVKNRQDLLI
ncbi:uncharacterized protein BX663DRAFT_523724 [Cokeromyces recurvatus]|uniref:uncharacterized protein n=1 Tax=Cokeromyces recurvatus TaxID=90255 RepID=UPI00221FBE96|nr:uncharacterized protein BX663DRAFT_523724 [Cokeromyces recurvatus]KAI7898682.1 hypothetical protein BX663DRAFT_523724 [Cokeromyces recurvatus]